MLQEIIREQASVAVVIPYFQRRTGVLSVALKSIFSQENVDFEKLQVIVVDDGSPVSPDVDLQQFDPLLRARVRIISQANAGPAAARNTGLDAVAPATRFVAFLDSDDQWLPHHLARALGVLSHVVHLYFSDNWLGEGISWFDSHPLTKRMLNAQRTKSEVVEFSGYELLKMLIEEPVVHLSTLVIDRHKLGSIRFRCELQTGEDHLYAMQVSDLASRVAIDRQPTMRRGDTGINFYREALDWNSARSAWRSLTTVQKYFFIVKEMKHHPEISNVAIRKSDIIMQETVFLIVRNFRRYPRETTSVMLEALGHWHFKCVYALVLLVKVLRRRMRGNLEFRV